MRSPLEIHDAMVEGRISALQAVVELKRITAEVETVNDAIREQAAEELRAFGKEGTTIDGAVITPMTGRASYDYKGIGAWRTLKTKMEAIEKDAKYAAQQLQKDGSKVYDEETGEVIEPCLVTYGRDGVQVKLLQ